MYFSEAVIGVALPEKGFLEISKNSQENAFARVSFLIKLLDEACNFIKKGDTGTDVFQ